MMHVTCLNLVAFPVISTEVVCSNCEASQQCLFEPTKQCRNGYESAETIRGTVRIQSSKIEVCKVCDILCPIATLY